MDCPQCQSDQIDETGACPSCGYKVPANVSTASMESKNEEPQNAAGMMDVGCVEGDADSIRQDEKPQWRQELSERLQAIRQKRESADLSGRRANEVAASLPAPRISVAPTPIIPAARALEDVPLRRFTPKPLTPIPRQKPLEPLPHGPSAQDPKPRPADPKDIQALIDNAVSKKSIPSDAQEEQGGIIEPADYEFPENEGKLILLSRTLCGLVDLIIIMVCTGGFILAADFFSGILVLDAVSYLYFALVFLLTYFSYSLFFLLASSQTIGMMITDLRVVGIYHERPSFRQLFQRCWGYLLSLLGLGFGLIWGLFDREAFCFHDRISDTQVIRL